jgi:hypothetical protein
MLRLTVCKQDMNMRAGLTGVYSHSEEPFCSMVVLKDCPYINKT